VTEHHYIFGFFEGIAKYSKSFLMMNNYSSISMVYSIAPYHNDPNVLILGEFGNNIEIINSSSSASSMAQLAHYKFLNFDCDE
jgi:hypothetical protein